MIKTKADLNFYLQADKQRLGIERINTLKRIAGNVFNSEKILIYTYIKRLRRTEFFYNNRTSGINHLRYFISLYKLKRIGTKTMINIGLNTIGPGLAIYHIGPIIVNPQVRIGENCGLQPGVVIGQTKQNHVPVIGNNVYFGPGAKAFGKVRIGDDVIVAPNSVVVKDVPNGCVVSGVPAVIIKRQ